MHQLSHFFKEHNLKPFMTVYLAVVHLYALIGFIYSVFHPETLLKVKCLLFRSWEFMLPFTCCMRWESREGRIGCGHIKLIMQDRLSDSSLCYLIQVLAIQHRCKSRLNLSLVPRPPPSSQVLRHPHRSPLDGSRYVLRAHGLAPAEQKPRVNC